MLNWLVDIDEVATISQQGYTILDNGGDYQPAQDRQEAPGQVEQSQPELFWPGGPGKPASLIHFGSDYHDF